MGMKLLHTGDWHLGHAFHGLERDHEFEAFFAWLLGTLERERIDALLVAGDVFDASNPPASATALWYRFLADAWRRLPGLQLVVIGGNHDSAARLDAPDPLLRQLGRMTVIGGLPRDRDGAFDPARTVVPLVARDGTVWGQVAAVPFLRPGDLPRAEGDGDDPIDGVRRVYARALEAARARREPGQALVAMGHLYMVGGQVSDLSERKILGGNLHAVPDEVFPADVSYVALGHLHLAQPVGGRETVRYAGSVLPLSFPERTYAHAAQLVEVEGGEVVSVRPLPVPRVNDVLVVPEGGPRPLAEVLERLRGLPARTGGPDQERPYLEVHVSLDRPEPALRRLLDDALAGREARLVRIAPPRLPGAKADEEASPSLQDLSVEEVFRRRWAREFPGEPPAELLAAFHELVDEASRDGGAA
jgi:exonuclease SbcD